MFSILIYTVLFGLFVSFLIFLIPDADQESYEMGRNNFLIWLLVSLIFIPVLYFTNPYLNEYIEKLNSVNQSKSSSSASKSSSSTSRKKECRCCGKRFTHSGYKIGYGETAYGNIDKIGVQPGPYDSEYCAFLCEHMD